MTITLYDCPTAPSPRRARILLAEKGVTHRTINIDLSQHEQMSEAYRPGKSLLHRSCTRTGGRTDSH